MKIEIDVWGYLFLERAGKMMKQSCPHNPEERCGDWCPLFGEPYEIVFFDSKLGEKKAGKTITIGLCKGSLSSKYDEFIDKRPK